MLRKVKVALTSRYLFDNWISLLVKYALIRLGFNVRFRAKIDNCFLELKPEVFAHLVSRFSRFFIRSLKCIDGKLFINGVEVDDISNVLYNVETFAKVLGWNYDNSSNCWVKNCVKFKRIHWPILLIFDYGEYDELNVRDRVVVDVGAFVGDSAIYFALRGAKRVIAIEPHPDAYVELLENVKLNNLEEAIFPINAGVAGSPSKLYIGGVDVEDTAHTYYKPACNGSIPVITLGDVIRRYVAGDAILKMDCEGCEYDVILNDYEHVRVFKELIFEYHAYAVGKSVSELLRVLAKDYNCKIIEGNKSTGIVHCIRK